VQGPPGTGKTYVGAELCSILVQHTDTTVLCVCYTNHALDQFLESLLKKGIRDIVRIGGRSRSEQLKTFNLAELVQANRTGGSDGMSYAERRRVFEV
jgi:superfamily II DNA or RNA helicase